MKATVKACPPGKSKSTRRRRLSAPESERALMIRIRYAVASMEGVLIWRNNCGVDTTRGVRYGLAVGSADLIGIVRTASGVGRFLALEVKRPGQRPTAEQRRWLDAVRRAGGYAALVRSVDEARAAVAAARGT